MRAKLTEAPQDVRAFWKTSERPGDRKALSHTGSEKRVASMPTIIKALNTGLVSPKVMEGITAYFKNRDSEVQA